MSWLLCTLVHSVVRAFGETQEKTTIRTETRETGDFGYGDDLADGLGVTYDDLVPLEGIENLGTGDRAGLDGD